MKFPHILSNLFFTLFILASCDQKPASDDSLDWQLLTARDIGSSLERPFVYRALVPESWIRQDPSPTESIADSTKPNCTFYIEEEGQTIRLTVHTFPTLAGNRIPPQAQISRWKGQFKELDPLAMNTRSSSHGGFSGLFFEGEGIVEGKQALMMGWSMQLAPAYDRLLSLEKNPQDIYKRGDYTIKALGPPSLMGKHRFAILEFAQSFELIDELPSL